MPTINAQTTPFAAVVTTADNTGNLALQTANVTAVTITTAQNVGIGTTSPDFSTFNASSNGIAIKSSNTYGLIKLGGATGDFYLASGSTGAAWLWNVSNAEMRFGTNNAERMRINSSGNVGIGTTFFLNRSGDGTAALQTCNAISGNGGIAIQTFANNAFANSFDFFKSRSGTIGTNTVVQSGDTIGKLVWGGADGTNYIEAASIVAQVDGTPGTNDMPGRLVFSTTADGGSSSSERMRIASTGALGFSGANYGSSGQVLTSNGSGSAPSWQAAAGGVTSLNGQTGAITNTDFGAIGSYMIGGTVTSTSSTGPGNTYAGSSLRTSSCNGFNYQNPSLTGTWRMMNAMYQNSDTASPRADAIGLFVRVS